ncbi:hypothetical protein [Nesterenkonia populi]|uniref:hypothetical protein n=1 Tax=Nesterenkonia populi TaxID=1591087 RepID=UPI0011BD9989|nr:hypothetical protein [Nesterenkonia populi]
MDLAPFHALLTANAQVDGPTWAPILFAAGAFALMVVVLFTMRQKIRANEQWQKAREDAEDVDGGESGQHGEHDSKD